MDAVRRNQTDLRLHILCCVRAPAKFALADIAGALKCELALVEEIAGMVGENREPTNPMTCEKIAEIIGVSPQAIGACEHQAIQRMKHPTRMRILMPLRDSVFA